jgi:hypothetical protein
LLQGLDLIVPICLAGLHISLTLSQYLLDTLEVRNK